MMMGDEQHIAAGLVGPVLEYARVERAETSGSHFGLDSLVCGLMLFVPFFTGIMAIIFAIAAMRKPERATDRSFGIAGISLAGLNFALWILAAVA
jgi:hypothetical protein